jgi:hypothetical protein
MSFSYRNSIVYDDASSSFSYSYDGGGCAPNCSTKVRETFGDDEAFCALDDVSCTDDCGAEWIAAHCACGTNALIASYSYDFLGDEA